MKRTILFPALVLGIATGSAALAQEQPGADAPEPGAMMEHGSGGMFGGMDADGNGSISPEEFANARLDALRASDADGDGTLSLEELQDYVLQREVERKANRLAMFLDIDGDGEVTVAELENQRAKRFALMDSNDDGTLDAREMRRGMREMMSGRGGHHGRQMGMRRMQDFESLPPADDVAPEAEEE